MAEISKSCNSSIAEVNGTSYNCDYETLLSNCLSSNSSKVTAYWQQVLSTKLWQIVPPILMVVGLTGNVLVMAVLRVMNISKNIALFFFFIMALSDSAVLIVALLRYWLHFTFEVDIRTLSQPGCKIIFFLTYFTMQLSSWTLAAVTVERYIVIRHSLRAREFVTMKRARIAMFLIVLSLGLVNGYLLFTQHIKEDSCGSLSCGSFEGDDIYFFDENVFIWIDTFVLCIIPFCVMLGCNIVIIREVKANVARHDKLGPSDANCKPSNTSSKVSSITTMLLAVNLYFLVTTIPISVYFILDTFLSSRLKDDASIEAKMELAWTITYLLQFTNYSLNFYLYVARGKRFRSGLKKLFNMHYENDSVDTRRHTVADLNQTTPAWRRGTLTENNVTFMRRSTVIGDKIDQDKEEAQLSHANRRRATLADTNTKPVAICNM